MVSETSTLESRSNPACVRTSFCVEYVLSEPHSYCVWISKKSEGVKELPAGRKQIEELTRKFLDETRAKRDDIGLAQQLYDVLLSPLPQEATSERLIVVPDGILNLLPFDTLRDQTGLSFGGKADH